MPPYIALIHKDHDSDYGVSFPDLPGCITAGSTLDEARAMAAEALALHLEGLEADGEDLPEPSTLDTIMTNKVNRDAAVIVVDRPRAALTSIRINVTLPSDVLAEIDRYVQAQGLTRSGFLARAARKELAAS